MKLIEELKSVKEKVGKKVKKRIKEFEKNWECEEKILMELFFCILTANFNAERSIRIQQAIGREFLNLNESELEKRLKELGYRFPKRAKYIVKARNLPIKRILESLKDEREAREWLAKNVDGIGYKEASHFLRNIGFKNLAIIDFHILNVLERNGIVKRPKSLTPKRYLEIEEKLREIAEKLGVSLAELDLYLWFLETGKILK